MWWLLAWVVSGLAVALALGYIAEHAPREPKWCGRPEGHHGPCAAEPLPGDG